MLEIIEYVYYNSIFSFIYNLFYVKCRHKSKMNNKKGNNELGIATITKKEKKKTWKRIYGDEKS